MSVLARWSSQHEMLGLALSHYNHYSYLKNQTQKTLLKRNKNPEATSGSWSVVSGFAHFSWSSFGHCLPFEAKRAARPKSRWPPLCGVQCCWPYRCDSCRASRCLGRCVNHGASWNQISEWTVLGPIDLTVTQISNTEVPSWQTSSWIQLRPPGYFVWTPSSCHYLLLLMPGSCWSRCSLFFILDAFAWLVAWWPTWPAQPTRTALRTFCSLLPIRNGSGIFMFSAQLWQKPRSSGLRWAQVSSWWPFLPASSWSSLPCSAAISLRRSWPLKIGFSNSITSSMQRLELEKITGVQKYWCVSLDAVRCFLIFSYVFFCLCV